MFPKEENPKIKRVQFELRATGVNPDQANPLRSGTHSRGYLPHVKREGARYFITFRLADSLPKEVLLQFEAERAAALHQFDAQCAAAQRLGTAPPAADTPERIERDYRRQIERFLDRGCGECWLRRPDLADLVAGALRFFDGQRYRVDAWVVMPNHVHAVFWPMPGYLVGKIVQSWEGFTARQANKVLNRTGASFWQPESYDHWIRNDEEHTRCCRYVRENPVKAGLCQTAEEWRWSSARSAELHSAVSPTCSRPDR